MPTPSTAPAFGDADIPAMMADVGIAITVGGVGGRGILNEGDMVLVQDAQRGEVIVKASTLIVQTSAFPNVAIDQVVLVNSKSFKVRSRLPEGEDGGLMKLVLGV